MPSRGSRIGKALARAHTKLTQVFFDSDCLKVLTGTQAPYTPLAEYIHGWYLDNYEYSDVVAGKKFKKLWVDDVDGCRLSELRKATAIQVGDTVFKFSTKPSFIGSVPCYEFRLQPTGERV